MKDDDAQEDIDLLRKYRPDALRLAEAACIAARIEPELLRALRLRLFPRMTADAEADLWFSPLAQYQNPVMMVLLPAVAHHLQQQLKADAALLDGAWEITEAMHRPLPPALRAQEELTWLALQGEAKRPEAEAKLASILTAMIRDGRDGLAGWGAQALPRLPPELHGYQHFQMLALAVAVRLRTPLQSFAPSVNIPLPDADTRAWLLPKGLPETRLGVGLEEDTLQLSHPPSAATYEITLPAITLVVEIIDRSGDEERRRTMTVPQAGVGSMTVARTQLDLRTMDGLLYTVPRPDPSVELTWPEMIIELQRLLNILGFASPPISEEGVAGPATRVAVQAFQLDQGLPLDGLLTEALLRQLREVFAQGHQPTIPVHFQYWTGLRQPFLRGATLRGSWDSRGRASERWSAVPMEAFTADDGCPAFRATVQLHRDLVGETVRWGVAVQTVNDPETSGIAGEIDNPDSRERYLAFTLRSADQTERYDLTDCRRLGANKLVLPDGREPAIRFSVWAPNARSVEMVRGDAASGYIWSDGRGVLETLPMRKDDSAIWSTDVSQSPTLRNFASWDMVPYMFRVTKDDGSVAYRTDLYSRCQIGTGGKDPERPSGPPWDGTRQDLEGPKSCSVVIDPERVTELVEQIAWPETRWLSDEEFWYDEFNPDRAVPRKIEDLVIYEMHVDGLGLDRGAARGTLLDAINLIPYLRDLGVNAVELMPVSEYQGWCGWGYATSHYFAIKSSVGGRDQLKHFVRECHRNGIAVLLDVVYNHFTFDAERVQWMYDANDPERNIWYWYEGKPSDYTVTNGGYLDNGSSGWTPRYSEETVRRMFISSAAALLSEFHIDGFRVDLTQAIHRDNVRHVDGRSVPEANAFGQKFLREWSNTLKLIRPNVFLIAEDHSGWQGVRQPTDQGGLGFDATWYADYYFQMIGDALDNPSQARLLKHAGLGDNRPLKMTWFAGVLAESANGRIVYHASHDEAGNAPNSARTIVVAVNSGQLIGEARHIAEARVRFAVGVTVLAPGIPLFFMGEEVGASRPYRYNDFLDSREDFAALRAGSGATLFRFYADVIRLRLAHEAFRSRNIEILHAHDENRVLAFRRWVDDEYFVVIATLGNQPWRAGYTINSRHMRDGSWREVMNSDRESYGGSGVVNMGSQLASASGQVTVRLPAPGIVVLQRVVEPAVA